MPVVQVLYFLVPALVLADLVRGRSPSRWDLALGFGLSIPVVGWCVFAYALFSLSPYSHFAFIVTNLVFALGLFVRRRTIGELLRHARTAGRPCGESMVAVVLLAAGFLASLVLFRIDAHSLTCLFRGVATAIDLPFGNFEFLGGERPMLRIRTEEREGAFGILASFAYLWGFLGLRLFYAAATAATGLFGFLIARSMIARPGAARILVLVAFMGFPAAADTLVSDINTISFLVASGLVVVAVRRESPDWLVGAVFAILVASRHVAVVAGAGPLLYMILVQRRAPLATCARYAASALVVISPVILHHWFAFSGLFAFESFEAHPAATHRILGAQFSLNAMWNWPFYPDLVRTPFNPVPHYALLPAWLISRLGIVLAALAGVGLATMVRHRRNLLAALAWCAPYLLVIVINENWIQVEKLAAITPVLPFALVPIGAGAAWLLDAGATRRVAAIFVGAMVVVFAIHRGLMAVDAPADPRFHEAFPWVPDEAPAYLEVEREFLGLGLLPRPEWTRFPRAGDPWRDLRNAFAQPHYEGRRPSVNERITERMTPDMYRDGMRQANLDDTPEPAAPPVAHHLVVSLEHPWVTDGTWVRLEDGAGEPVGLTLDPTGQTGSATYEKFPSPWSPRLPLSLNALVYGDAVWVVISNPFPYEQDSGTYGTHLDGARMDVENPPIEHLRFGVPVPDGYRVFFVEVTSFEPGRFYVWSVSIDTDGIRLEGPVHWRSY